MKKVLFISTLISLFVSSNLLAQCGSHKKSYTKSSHKSHSNLVDIAADNDQFSTLVTAVKSAGLVATLSSDGPFTVFAPNNIAFSKLPEGTVESLLEPKAKNTLTSILTYHVIPAKITAETLVNAISAAGGAFTVNTVNGTELTAKIMNGNPVLIDAKGNKSFITQTDIEGSNGVIHVIDAVVMP